MKPILPMKALNPMKTMNISRLLALNLKYWTDYNNCGEAKPIPASTQQLPTEVTC